MIGTVRNSYVRRSSVHHTYNRAVAIHGVHHLRVQDNVAFENMGHAYFLSDGIETKNVITGNLGASTRPSYASLNVDQTPATFWISHPDNYVEGNVAAGSTHYGFWFYPEPRVRGASEFEPGADLVCPQGTPLLHFAHNEAHNNERYGLRIFTYPGIKLAGYYPTMAPCKPASATNPFVTARFRGQFSWRNGQNGVTIGSVAHVHLEDAVVADNNERGVEMVGGDAIETGLSSNTKLRGAWGANKLLRTTFVAHPLPCPACDHSFRPLMPMGKRLGLETPAWFGLTVEGATFINYDRAGLVAVAGFAKAFPSPYYNFMYAGAMETRFAHIAWHQSDHRVRWRWYDEALFVDMDGSFTGEQAGSSVLDSPLVADRAAFPDCYHDSRYGGTVCPPHTATGREIRFVQVGFLPADPMERIEHVRISHLPGGQYVRADDTAYLRDKWRPAGSAFLVQMDAATDVLRATMLGDPPALLPPWTSLVGRWVGPRVVQFDARYSGGARQLLAEMSSDGSVMTFVNGTDPEYGAHEVSTHVPWYHCEVVPRQCVGTTRYHQLPHYDAPKMNLRVTPHFEGSKFQFLLPANRRYLVESHTKQLMLHFEGLSMTVGQALRVGDFIEMETNPFSVGALLIACDYP